MAKADGHNEQCTMDNVQWKKVKLGDVCHPSNEKYNPLSEHEFQFCVEMENINQESGTLNGRSDISKLLSLKNKFQKGDVLYGKLRPYLKKFWLADYDGVCSTEIWVLKNADYIDNQFLFYLFQSENINRIANFSSGTKMPRADWQFMAKQDVDIPFENGNPSLPAQRRIAAILSAADKVIEQTRQLIGKYKSIKQGMMEDLLKPKEGWKKVKLGECLKKKPDYGINAPAVPYDNHLPTYLRITDITEDGYYSKKDIVSVANPEAWKYIMEEGDLVFARTGASVGKTYLYNPNDGVLVFAGFLIRVKANEDVLLPEFFKYQTQTPQYKNWIAANSMRTGQPGINGNEYEEYSFYLPFKNNRPDLPEQRRIAKILLGIDRKIEAEEKILEKYGKMKKGLMERLLRKE